MNLGGRQEEPGEIGEDKIQFARAFIAYYLLIVNSNRMDIHSNNGSAGPERIA